MLSVDDATARVAKAEAAGELSHPAAVNIKRWLAEPPFAAYRDRLIQDVEAGKWKVLDDAFYTVLEFGTGGRRGKMYPVGTNVLNDRTIGESARGLADYVTQTKGPNAPEVLRHRPRHPPQLARVRRPLCPGPRRGRVQGLPLPRAPLDPAALLRRPTPEVRRRDHDHRVAQPARRTTASSATPRPAARSSRPTTRASSNASRPRPIARSPRRTSTQAIKDGSIVLVGKEVDDAYITAVVGESVAKARDIGDRLHADARRRRDDLSPRRCWPTASRGSNILASQRTPDGDFPNVPDHVANPEIPATLDLAIAGPRRPAPTSCWPATPTPTASASACPSRATRRASGPRSTATRSAS